MDFSWKVQQLYRIHWAVSVSTGKSNNQRRVELLIQRSRYLHEVRGYAEAVRRSGVD